MGNVDLKPYKQGNRTACDYCPYHAVCGFDTKTAGYGYRKLKGLKPEEIWAELESEGDEETDVNWTSKQQEVIDSRNRNLLVSAAAGSGKTAVLVERIIQMISEGDRPLDIDQLLVMTFTNAAAAEMRERIGAAVEQKLKERPEDEHLWLQAALIPQAQITTIDRYRRTAAGSY